ncbi:MAG TPA: aspartate aminotransferase family protein [Jeotgalicoccus sp.]|nr:aspartate aminotransferase family protein [Jeotgalicoccus sp.]
MKTEDLIELGNSALFNTYNRGDKVLVSGKGTYVKNNDGEEYLDFVSGIATNILGHANEKIVKAITEQASTLIHTSNVYWNKPSIELAHKLVTDKSAGSLQKVFFSNSGAEANEGALKLARKYGKEVNGENCTEIITLTDSFHGRTMAALSATGQPDMHKDFQPLLPGSKYVPLNDSEALKDAVTENTCAVLVETIQGEGGINSLSDEFVETLKELQNNGQLLIIDEVQTGMGRTGTLFSFEQFGLEPDIVTLAKGLGGGYPMGAFMATDKVAGYFKPGDHGTTLGGNPLGSAVGNAIYDEIMEAGLLDNVAARSNQLVKGLEKISADTGCIAEIKGLGLLIGVQFNDSVEAADVLSACYSEKMLVVTAKHNVVRLLPPLNVTAAEIDEALEKFRKALEQLVK